MKNFTYIIAVISLAMGIASTSYAANSSARFVDESNQRIQQYRTMVSADTMLNYSNILLQKSTVAQNLKLSDNPVDTARYEKALGIHKQAEQAMQQGNSQQAKILALESIRMVARAIPHYYSQTAKVDK